MKIAGMFTIEFGRGGWIKDGNDKWAQLIVTQDGVFYNGEIIAKGKLKANEKHSALKD